MNGKYFYKNEEKLMPHNSSFSAGASKSPGDKLFSHGEMKGKNQMQSSQILLTKKKGPVTY